MRREAYDSSLPSLFIISILCSSSRCSSFEKQLICFSLCFGQTIAEVNSLSAIHISTVRRSEDFRTEIMLFIVFADKFFPDKLTVNFCRTAVDKSLASTSPSVGIMCFIASLRYFSYVLVFAEGLTHRASHSSSQSLYFTQINLLLFFRK